MHGPAANLLFSFRKSKYNGPTHARSTMVGAPLPPANGEPLPPALPSGNHVEFEVDFELGEDAPRNAEGRAAQEARWKLQQDRLDARHHFSVREALQVQRGTILNGLEDFERVRTLVSELGFRRAAPEEVAADVVDADAADESGAEPSLLSKLTPELLELVVESAMPGQGPLVEAMHLQPPPMAPPEAFRVFVRVRPLMDREVNAGEYKAVDDSAAAQLVCHDARMARSGRRLTMLHRWYRCDALFGSGAGESRVCDGVLMPLLGRAIAGEGDATLLLYGQTGAGKTHTMGSFLARIGAELDAADAAARPAIEVTFFEVTYNGCNDLLRDRAKIALRSDANDVVHACGAATTTVRSATELAAALEQALALRSTVQTQANPISSRSHAICCLRYCARAADGGIVAGRTLRLVDLAGSERNYETHYENSRAFQRESIAINKSLMALKDCFREAARAREAAAADATEAGAAAAVAVPNPDAGRGEAAGGEAAGGVGKAARPPIDQPWASRHKLTHRLPVRIPFRSSMLTRVLRDCFVEASHRTAIVAAVAPGAESVIHTLNTLDHVSLMAPHLWQTSCEVELPMGHGGGEGFSYEGVPVHEWSAQHVIEWLSNAEGGRFSQVVVPPGITGVDLLRMNARRLSEMVETEQREGRDDGQGWYVSSQAKVGRALFEALREAQRRAPIRKGAPSHLGALCRSRRTEMEREAAV